MFCILYVIIGCSVIVYDGRGGILVRVHASRAEGLRIESDSGLPLLCL